MRGSNLWRILACMAITFSSRLSPNRTHGRTMKVRKQEHLCEATGEAETGRESKGHPLQSPLILATLAVLILFMPGTPPAGDALDRAPSHRLVRCSPTDHQGKAAHLSCMLRMLRARRHGCTRLTWLRLSPLLSSAMPNGTRCLPGACREIEPGPLHRGHALSELAERDCRRRRFRGVEER